MTAENAALPVPPFYRGEKGEWEAVECDHFTEGDDTACDAPAAYYVEWKSRPELDNDTLPVSGACERHALLVDRRQVLRMRSHAHA